MADTQDIGRRGTIKWKVGPERDKDGNCITTAWGHKCVLDPKHEGFCAMILDPKRSIVIASDR